MPGWGCDSDLSAYSSFDRARLEVVGSALADADGADVETTDKPD